jgi:hypothetical protein
MRPTATRTTIASLVAAVALAGAVTADAAPLLSGANLKAGSVSGAKIKRNTLTGVQIKESTLGRVPLAQSAATADTAKAAETAKTADTATTAETAQTAQTADDAKTLTGKPATAFLSSAVHTVFKEAPPVPGPAGGNPSEVTVSCPAGEQAIGGGGAWIISNFQDNNQPTALDAPITASMPVPAAPAANEPITGWHVLGRNFSGTNRALRAYAICVPTTA